MLRTVFGESGLFHGDIKLRQILKVHFTVTAGVKKGRS